MSTEEPIAWKCPPKMSTENKSSDLVALVLFLVNALILLPFSGFFL